MQSSLDVVLVEVGGDLDVGDAGGRVLQSPENLAISMVTGALHPHVFAPVVPGLLGMDVDSFAQHFAVVVNVVGIDVLSESV